MKIGSSSRGLGDKMSEIWEVRDHQVICVKNNKIIPVSKQDFWEMRKSDTESNIGLQIMGFPHPELILTLIEEIPRIIIQFHTEIGIKTIFEMDSVAIDHVVINNNWFPLHEEQMIEINENLLKINLKVGSTVNFPEYIKILRLINQGIQEVHLDLDPSIFAQKSLDVSISSRIVGKPFDYQITGINWLTTLFRQKTGCILADEMGLGKTFQLIGLIANTTEIETLENLRILVIVPSSLKLNWKREFINFAPSIIPYIHAGADRVTDLTKFSEFQIVLTTYDILRRDIYIFKQFNWNLIVCDEAHTVKNRNSKVRIAVMELESDFKVLCTGTPIENSLTDLWSLIDIVKPGLMGDFNRFNKLIDNNPSDAEWIGKAVSPLILRRKVKDLENQLPPLIEIEQPLEVNQEFALAYESVRKGLISATSQMASIGRVTKLRQFCCYPPIVDREFNTSNNPKLERLIEILDEIYSMKTDQVIIFASFTDSIDVLLHEIKGRYGDVFVEPIDGRFNSDKRDQIVQEFQKLNRFGVLVINPQAGGQGLNIPAANHVIHYNLEWNPAKEQQATARAWRTGQKKTVFVHRMFYLGTVEEVIYDRLKLKSDVAQSALKPSEIEKEDKDVNRALAISPIF